MINSPQIGQKLHLKAEICIQKFFSTAFLWFTINAPLPTTFLLIDHSTSAPGGQNWKKKQWLPPLRMHGPKN